MNVLAYFFAIFKNVVYGSTVFFVDALNASTDVMDILALRFLVSFLVLWLLKVTGICKIKVGVKDFFVQNERSAFLPSLFLAALFEPVLYMLFETLGISMSSNIMVAVILCLAPVSTCLVEVLVLKEHSTPLQMILLGVGMVGVLLIAILGGNDGGQNSFLGIFFLISAVVCGSLFGAFSRKSSKHFAPMEVTYLSSLLGALAFNVVNVVRHLWKGDLVHYFDPYFNVENLIGFFVLGVLSTIVATGMNNYCFGKMQISVMAAFGGISTLVTVLIGVFWKGEKMYWYHFVGFSLIFIRMVGVSYLSIRRENAQRRKAESERPFEQEEAKEPLSP